MISNRSKGISKKTKFTQNSASNLTEEAAEEDVIPKHLIEVTKLPLRQREPIAKDGTTWLMQPSRLQLVELGSGTEQGRKITPGRFSFNGLNQKNDINTKTNYLTQSHTQQSTLR